MQMKTEDYFSSQALRSHRSLGHVQRGKHSRRSPNGKSRNIDSVEKKKIYPTMAISKPKTYITTTSSLKQHFARYHTLSGQRNSTKQQAQQQQRGCKDETSDIYRFEQFWPMSPSDGIKPEVLSTFPAELSHSGDLESDGEDEDEDRDSSPASKQNDNSDKTTESKEELLWACPYYKYDPIQHASCMSLVMRRIRDVKQHLHRRHSDSDSGTHTCFECSRCFSDAKSVMQHIRSSEKCGPQASTSQKANINVSPGTEFNQIIAPATSFSPDTQKRLRGRSDRKVNSETQWFAIWHILFPGETEPSSPHLHTPIIKEVMGIFQDFLQRDGLGLVHEIMETKFEVGIDNQDVLDLLKDCLNGIIQRLENKSKSSLTSTSPICYTPLSSPVISSAAGPNIINTTTPSSSQDRDISMPWTLNAIDAFLPAATFNL